MSKEIKLKKLSGDISVCWVKEEDGCSRGRGIRSGRIDYRLGHFVEDRPTNTEELIAKAAKSLEIRPREARELFYRQGVLKWEAEDLPFCDSRDMDWKKRGIVNKRILERQKKDNRKVEIC